MEPQHGIQEIIGKLPAGRNEGSQYRKVNQPHQEEVPGGDPENQGVFRLCGKYGTEA